MKYALRFEPTGQDDPAAVWVWFVDDGVRYVERDEHGDVSPVRTPGDVVDGLSETLFVDMQLRAELSESVRRVPFTDVPDSARDDFGGDDDDRLEV